MVWKLRFVFFSSRAARSTWRLRTWSSNSSTAPRAVRPDPERSGSPGSSGDAAGARSASSASSASSTTATRSKVMERRPRGQLGRRHDSRGSRPAPRGPPRRPAYAGQPPPVVIRIGVDIGLSSSRGETDAAAGVVGRSRQAMGTGRGVTALLRRPYRTGRPPRASSQLEERSSQVARCSCPALRADSAGVEPSSRRAVGSAPAATSRSASAWSPFWAASWRGV